MNQIFKRGLALLLCLFSLAVCAPAACAAETQGQGNQTVTTEDASATDTTESIDASVDADATEEVSPEPTAEEPTEPTAPESTAADAEITSNISADAADTADMADMKDTAGQEDGIALASVSDYEFSTILSASQTTSANCYLTYVGGSGTRAVSIHQVTTGGSTYWAYCADARKDWPGSYSDFTKTALPSSGFYQVQRVVLALGFGDNNTARLKQRFGYSLNNYEAYQATQIVLWAAQVWEEQWSYLGSAPATIRAGVENYWQVKTPSGKSANARNFALALADAAQTVCEDGFSGSLAMTQDSTTQTTVRYKLTVKTSNYFGGYTAALTGAPTLEKEVADAAHGLSFSAAENSYEDVATASQGDVLNYRIRSTLPQITSDATRLTRYEFVDILSGGIQYRKGDVKVCWYQDAATAKADYTAATEQNSAVNGSHADLTWDTDSDYFSVRYGSGADNASTMTVTLTEAGLAQVNTAADGKNTGHYSGWTMVIYYSAIVSSDASVVVGDAGNPNEVTLTWSRTTDGYYDTLTDRARVYTYGIDLTKVLSEGGTDFASVQFLLENTTNKTGSFYLLAEQAEDGVYYITGSTAAEADATRFCPSAEGKLLIYGLEEDSYRITEVKTASGYTLLKDPIDLVISTDYTADPTCGSLTASATVDGAAVTMEELGDSDNALVPLTVVNNRGFDLPKTGGAGTTATTVCGVLLICGVTALALHKVRKKRRH